MRLAVVADDLTGANVTATYLLRQGLRCRVVAYPDAPLGGGVEEAVLLNADSRSLPAAQAYARVRQCVERLKPPAELPLSKRLDSTARGNLGAEIDAVLEASGRRVCLVVLADPAQGKQTIGGQLLIGSVPVDQTVVAHDPIHPVDTARIAELIRRQSRYPVSELTLVQVRAGATAVRAHLAHQGSGPQILVCDCAEVADLAALAAVGRDLGEPVVAADPGPFTQHLAAILLSPPQTRPVFLVCGSPQANIAAQLEHLRSEVGALLLEVPPGQGADPGFRARAEAWIAELSQPGESARVIGVHSGLERVNTAADGGEQLVQELVALAAHLLDRLPHAPAGLVMTGGQTAVALCRVLGITSVEVTGEVLPYAATGVVRDGRWAGLPLVTKGGLIGDASALTRSVSYILDWRGRF